MSTVMCLLYSKGRRGVYESGMQRRIPQEFRGIMVLTYQRQGESELGYLMSGKNEQRTPIWPFSVLLRKLMSSTLVADFDNV
jgi:hypothetical protein